MNKLLTVIGLTIVMLIPNVTLGGTTKVKKYSHISMNEDRTVLIKGPIRSTMADKIVQEVYELGQFSNKSIYYIIDTNGGSLMAGNQIIRAMESSSAKSICIVNRAAYSMGALILSHCNTAYIHKDASVMFHEGYLRLGGRVSEVFSYVNFEKKEIDKLNRNTAKLLNMSLNTYIAKQKDEWWLTAEDTVRLGLTKGIINQLQFPIPERKQNFFTVFGVIDNYNLWQTEDGVYDLTLYPQTKNPYRGWLEKR